MLFGFVSVVYAGYDDVYAELQEFLEFRFLEMKFDNLLLIADFEIMIFYAHQLLKL